MGRIAIYKNYIKHDQLTDFELLLSLIRADLTEEQVNSIFLRLENRTVDWDFVLNLADKHCILPIFYANIQKLSLHDFLPSSVRNSLHCRYLKIIAGNLCLEKKLIEVLALFEDRGIPAVPFKGPVLAHRLYSESMFRYYQDLDILVSKKDVIAARDALLDAGFLLSDQCFSGDQLKKFIKYGKECVFIDPSFNAAVDLHWRLAGFLHHPYDFEFCKERLQLIRFNEHKIFCLSDEDILLHLCLNGTSDMWHNLEQILCVANFLDKHQDLNWELVQKLADRLHCRRMFYLGIFLARDLFGALIPYEIDRKISNDRVLKNICKKIYTYFFQGITEKSHIEKKIAQIPCHVKVREYPTDKLLYILERIFIPTQKDWQNRSLDPPFLIFYYMLRPFDLMVELRRARRTASNRI